MGQTQADLSGAYRWRPDTDDSFVDEHWDYRPDDERLTTGPSDVPDDDIRAGSLFKREIQRDAEICSSCFLRNYDIVLPHSDRSSVESGLVRYFIPIESTTHSESGAARTCRNPPRACQCGRLNDVRVRPLDKPHVAAFARNLSRTITGKARALLREADRVAYFEDERKRERLHAEAERLADTNTDTNAAAYLHHDAERFRDEGEAPAIRRQAERYEHDPLLLAFSALLRKSERPMSDDENFADALDDARRATPDRWRDVIVPDGQRRRALPAPDDGPTKRVRHRYHG